MGKAVNNVPDDTYYLDRDVAPGQEGSDPKSARDAVLHILWRRKWTVFVCIALSLAAAGAYLALAPRVYLSDSKIYVQPGGPQLMADPTGVAGGGAQAANPNFQFRQCQMITSTPILALTLADKDVRNTETLAELENPFSYLKEHVAAEVGREDEVITITAEAASPQDAAVIVNAVREAYVAYQTKQKKSTVVEVREILGSERTRAEKELSDTNSRMLEFRRNRGHVDDGRGGPGAKNDIVIQRLQSLSQALTDAQLKTLAAKGAHDQAMKGIGKDKQKLAMLAKIDESGAVSVVSEADELAMQQELIQWQTHLQELQGDRFLPNHPRVKSAKRRVDTLQVAYASALSKRYAAAREHEAALQVAFEKQQKVAIDRSTDADEYQQMADRRSRLETRISDLDKRMKDLNVAEAGTGMNIELVEVGEPPKGPHSPDPRKSLAVALVLGLMFGVTLALVRDWSDPRLHHAEQVQATLGLSVLGQIPQMAGSLAPSVRGQRILLEPAGNVAESCRSLRTAIQFGVPAGRAKTILVASPASGDGKSTIASNLAIAFAQSGKRVLILDADLRRPSQHETFGVDDAVGLSDVLAEEKTAEQAIQASTVANLDVLPAGPQPENPAELLNSPAFVEVLEALADKYDHVIIDSPPVVGVTDARIIAASCDITLLVLRAESSNRKLAQMTRDGLISVGGQLLGVVLNGVTPDAAQTATYGGAAYGAHPSRNRDTAAPAPGGLTRQNGRELLDEVVRETVRGNAAAGADEPLPTRDQRRPTGS